MIDEAALTVAAKSDSLSSKMWSGKALRAFGKA
jgi:hypothetical protein